MAQTPAVIQSPLWDRIYVLSTTSPTTLNFFQVQQGATEPNGSYIKTKRDTNMTQSGGRLSGVESFVVKGISLVFDFNTSEADITLFANNTWLEFKTSGGTITQLELPLFAIPAGTGLPFSKSNATAAQIGVPSPIGRYSLDPDKFINIDVGESFVVNWYMGNSALSLSANIKVTCVLHGDHYMIARQGQPLVGVR